MEPNVYLENILPQFVQGWEVLFEMDPTVDLPSQACAVRRLAAIYMPQRVSLNQTQLVVGLANGWAGSYSSLLIMPAYVGQAFATLADRGIVPRGVAFWVRCVREAAAVQLWRRTSATRATCRPTSTRPSISPQGSTSGCTPAASTAACSETQHNTTQARQAQKNFSRRGSSGRTLVESTPRPHSRHTMVYS